MTVAHDRSSAESHAASHPRTSAEARDGAPVGHWIARSWHALSLPGQFLLAIGVMLAFFSFVDEHLHMRTLQYALRQNSAETSSIYISGIIAPLVPVPVNVMKPGSEAYKRMDQAIADAGLIQTIERLKIWSLDGTIIYSTVPELVGQKFAIEELLPAARGEIVFGTSDPEREQDHVGAQSHKPMLEVHVPIRDATGSVVAVGEFHKDITTLEARSEATVRLTWLLRAFSLLVGMATLFFIVKRAHATIMRQESQLRQQYEGAAQLAEQNEALRRTAEELRRKAVQSNEELLSRVGAEIHDGPVQLLSIAMISMGTPEEAPPTRKEGSAPARPQPAELVSNVIEQLRTISTGLILPELEDLLPSDVILLAIDQHERLTGTKIEADIAELPEDISSSLTACLFRVVQECMNNSTRHAEGRGLSVMARLEGRNIKLMISDEGPGLSPSALDDRSKLGLLGVRNRVEAFGGTLSLSRGERAGTVVTAMLPIDGNESRLGDQEPRAAREHSIA